MSPLVSVKVACKVDETPEIASYVLEPCDGATLPPFTPGAHIDVHLAGGLIRQYSLCNEPGDANRYVIAVKKEANSRGGSRAMHDAVKEGDVLTISAPRNHFPLASEAAHHVLIGGGIGVTPLLSMAHFLHARGASFELHYFVRSVTHAAFHGLLSACGFHGKVVFHYGLEPAELKPCVGAVLAQPSTGTHVYLCGPRPFMDAVADMAQQSLPGACIHMEYFASDSAALAEGRHGFDIELALSGMSCHVPADKSIVAVLAANGVFIDTSCEQGVCGTCLTGVIAGEIDHRDTVLSEQQRRAGDKIMPCVSRASGRRLVLDL